MTGSPDAPGPTPPPAAPAGGTVAGRAALGDTRSLTGHPLPADPAAQPAARDAPLVNIANALTTLRLLLVPAVLVLGAVHGGRDAGWRVATWGAFAVASFTDRIDGSLARRHNLVTSFGKLADPIADKALTGAVLLQLSAHHVLPWWVTVVILVREVGVTGLRFWVIRHGVIAASRGGKAKTVLQGLAIGGYLLPLGAGPLGALRAVLLGAALAVTVVTGADYVARAVRLRRGSARALAARAARTAAAGTAAGTTAGTTAGTRAGTRAGTTAGTAAGAAAPTPPAAAGVPGPPPPPRGGR